MRKGPSFVGLVVLVVLVSVSVSQEAGQREDVSWSEEFVVSTVQQDETKQNENGQTTPDNTLRVAIIGAGISSAMVARQLRKQIATKRPVEITVFEQADRVGGRIRETSETSLFATEMGAKQWHQTHRTIDDVVEEYLVATDQWFLLSSPSVRSAAGDSHAFWDSQSIVFQETEWTYLRSVEKLWRYKLDPFSLTNVVFSLTSSFDRIYTRIHSIKPDPKKPDPTPFQTIEEYLEETWMGVWAEMTFDEYLSQATMMGDNTKREFVTALLRLNHQGNVSHATLPSMLELQLSSGHGFSLRTYRPPSTSSSSAPKSRLLTGLIEWLFESTNSTVHLSKAVRSISFDSSSKKFTIVSTDNDQTFSSFDSVILTVPHPDRISFSGLDLPEGWSGNIKTQTIHSTIVEGHLNVSHFAPGSDHDQPQKILTILPSDPSLPPSPLLSITVAHKFSESGHRVYRVISTSRLSDEDLDLFFKERMNTTRCEFADDPVYDAVPKVKNMRFQPLPDVPLFNVNIMEVLFSSLESQAISALNSVSLLDSFFFPK